MLFMNIWERIHEEQLMGKLQNGEGKGVMIVGYFELCLIIKILWDLPRLILVEQIYENHVGFTEKYTYGESHDEERLMYRILQMGLQMEL